MLFRSRGFIGEICSDAGWQVTFVDAAASLVTALKDGWYPHDTVSSEGTVRKRVTGCTALSTEEKQAVADAVAAADVVFTSVGARNLPRVAPTLADGLARRARRAGGPLDVFLAENVHDGPALMRALLAEELTSLGAAADAILADVGLVETSIGRMIPVPTAEQMAEHPALVAVEPYRSLPFDVQACRAPVPSVPELIGNPDVDFSFYVQRKLYVHNQGHTFTAYLGGLAGYAEIAESIRDERILPRVRAAMLAPALALAAKYGQPEAELTDHVEDLLSRFGNEALHDTVERVGRDPERKLQLGERFLGALALTAEWGDTAPLVDGIAVAVTYLGRDDGQMRAEVARLAPGHLERFDRVIEAVRQAP